MLVIVLHALERVSRRALDGAFHYLMAAAAFVAIFFLQLPFPIIILAAAVAGALHTREHQETTAIDWLGQQPRLQGAMSGITAAVVGVILNLSIWFALHVMFSQVNEIHRGPFTLWLADLSTLDWRVPVLAVFCGWLLLMRHWSVLRVLGAVAVTGLLMSIF